MAINNQYSQTPKRVYSNKPFLAGMNYTNADLQPNVCRAVANLEMESSNTATKVRQGTTNKIIKFDSNSNYYILRFYTKLVAFRYTISEEEYNNNIIPSYPSGLGLKVSTYESDMENKIFDYIVSNINDIEYDKTTNTITAPNNTSFRIPTSQCKILALKTNEGIIPRAINNNDFSFTFFGVLLQNDAIKYKGLIKLYNHVAASQIIIEYYKPTITDVYDVQNYGSNLIASNPLLYKDYVYIDDTHNYYTDYMGNQSKDVIDITTVQVYTAGGSTSMIAPIVETTSAELITADIVQGFNCDTVSNDYIVVRPYYVMPKGDYCAAVKVSKITGNKILSSDGITYNDEVLDYYYNFTDNVFDTNIALSPDFDATNIASNTNVYNINTGYNVNTDLQKIYFDEHPITFNLDGISSDFANLSFNISDTDLMTSFVFDILTGEELNDYLKTYAYDDSSSYNVYQCTYINIPSQNIDTDSYYEYKTNHTGISTAITTNINYITNTYLYIFDNNNNFIDYKLVPDYSINTTVNYPNESQEDHLTRPPVKLNLKSYYSASNNTLCVYLDYWSYTYYMLDTQNEQTWENNAWDNTKANWAYSYLYNNITIKKNTSGVNTKTYEVNADTLIQNDDIDADLNFYHKLGMLVSNRLKAYTVTNNVGDLHPTDGTFIDRYTVTKTDLTFNIGLTYKNNMYAINQNCIKNVQYIDTLNNNTLVYSYNLNLQKKAFKSLDLSSTVMSVILFKKDKVINNYYVYSETDAITATTAVIQLNNEVVLSHQNALEQTTLFSQANNLGTHLGYYIVYGKYTGYKSLYYSMFNDCSYFPSMYKIDFDNDIVHIHQHLGNLIVFTTEDIYMLYNGSVPATVSTDGSEVPFTKKLIQANVKLGYDNVNTVRSIGKDVFFISTDNEGYLLKSNKYVNNDADVYVLKITNQIADLLDSPYNYAKDRYKCYYPENTITNAVQTKYTYRDNIIHLVPFANPEYSDEPKVIISGSSNIANIEVYDGDTFKYNSVIYRLGSIDCPELTTDRLGATAGAYLKYLFNQSTTIYIFHNNIQDNFGRYICYVYAEKFPNVYPVNAQLLKLGLAKLDFYDYTEDLSYTFNDVTYKLYEDIVEASAYARKYKLGIYNTIEYKEPTYTINDYNTAFVIPANYFVKDTTFVGYNYNVNSLYTYTTNSYINVIQSVLLSATQGLTIIYKYNIDNRTWISYDVPFALFPTDIATDTSRTGYMLCCSNDYHNGSVISSTLTFNKSFKDTTTIGMNRNPYELSESLERDINVYFDSGNQSISLLYDKLFREIKISLGALPDDKLSTDYIVNFYVDGINTRVRPHYSGKQEETEGFKKVTFLTPARGRIPRFTFSADCKSSINILEYALIYLQLNAK